MAKINTLKSCQFIGNNGKSIFPLYIIFSILLLQSFHKTYSVPSKTIETKFNVWMERFPESKVAPKGDEVLFVCEINIIPDSIEWRFRHVSVHENFNGYQIMSANNITNNDNVSKLRIYVSSDTIGEYQCVAWFGTSALASTTAQLSLASIIEINNYNNYKDYIRNFQNQDNILKWKIAPKNSVLIKCGSILSNPMPVWSFYKNNIPILPIDPQWPLGSLVLNSITSKDSGTYSCSAMNAITGQEIKLKESIELIVDYAQRSAPHFLLPPETKVSAYPGQTVLLECPGVGNPNPKPVWSAPQITGNHITNERTKVLPYGLQIINVQSYDNGTYTCRLDNGLLPVLVHTIRLEVFEKPIIIRGPGLSLANESNPWELECLAKGTPDPIIYWMINGVDTRTDNSINHQGNRLIIPKMKKAYAGFVQCFAKNEAGESVSSNLLQVNPQQVNSTVLGHLPTQSVHDHKVKQKKKHKSPTMIPPNIPNVSRLSDDSVMLRWSVPKNDGLDITFFKVQYKMLDRSKTVPRNTWQTTNEEVAFGKRNNKMRNFTIPVSGLLPDHYYRFRILAVYSNNDNKEGPSTGKFLLQSAATLGKDKDFLPPPTLIAVEGISEHAISLQWNFPENIYIDGFYVHYRSVLSAGEYTKQTIEGMNTRNYKIENLEPYTAYEFKLQSFSLSTASDFSMIINGRTKKAAAIPTFIKNIKNPSEQQTVKTQTYYTVIAGTAGVILIILILITVVYVLYKWKRSNSNNDEGKSHIDHIQADGHVVSSMHKNNQRLKGSINITPNPLALEGEKDNFCSKSKQQRDIGLETLERVELRGADYNSSIRSEKSKFNKPMESSNNSIRRDNNNDNNRKEFSYPQSIPQNQHISNFDTSNFPQRKSHQQQQLHLANKQQHHIINLHSQVRQQRSSSPYHSLNIQNINSTASTHKNHSDNHVTKNNSQYKNVSNNINNETLADYNSRIIDKSNRNLHYAVDVQSNRVPQLRPVRQSPYVENICITSSPKLNRSPKCLRSQVRNYGGKINENLSSGSLNSIEV